MFFPDIKSSNTLEIWFKFVQRINGAPGTSHYIHKMGINNTEWVIQWDPYRGKLIIS